MDLRERETTQTHHKKDSRGFSALFFPDETDEQNQAGSCNQKYYGVSLPERGESVKESEFIGERESFVFCNKSDAMDAIKRFSEARFKEFETYEKALAYASTPSSSLAPSSSGASVSHALDEKKVFCKSVSSQELVNFRKEIENGRESNFYDLVWSNPRYLVNSIDCPTTLQTGTHSNALHIVSRNLQTDLCLAICNTLYDIRFIQLLYPDDNDNTSVLEVRRKHIMDLYLNTADKSLGETPLHYASKFGSAEIVQILLSYEWCLKDKRNKFNMRPVDIICERSSQKCINSEELKSKIKSLFEDSSCVPILRDVNNIAEPIFGEPCAASVKEKVVIRGSLAPPPRIFLRDLSLSLSKDHVLSPCAFAGPMSNRDAKNFFLACKKKKFSQLPHLYSTDDEQELKHILLSDPTSGLERVGRKIAKDCNYQWIEFWPVLCGGVWTDISSDYGLSILESHLRCRTKILVFGEQISALNMDKKCEALIALLENGLVHSFCDIANQIIDNIKQKNVLHLFQSLIPETFCMTSYSFSKNEFLKQVHEEIAQIIYLKLSSQSEITDSVLHSFIMKINAKLDFTSISDSKNWKFLICIIRYLIFLHHGFFHQTETPCNALMLKPTCFCDWVYESDYVFDSQVAYYQFLKMRQNLYNKMFLIEKISEIEMIGDHTLPSAEAGPSLSSLMCVCVGTETEKCAPELFSGDDTFFTPPESPDISDCSVTPKFKHRCLNTYLNGYTISDDDIDMYKALEKHPISSVLYPSLYKWKSLMESKLENFLRPSTELYRTPAVASATLKRLLTEIDGKPRRLLF